MHSKENNPVIDISVDCVVFGFAEDQLKVLLIRQKRGANKSFESDYTQFALPGDFVQQDESLKESASRVLKELTQLEGIYLKQFHTFGNPERVKDSKDQDWLQDFRKHPERRVITVAYYSLVNMEEYIPNPASFAGETFWADVNEVPNLAFDHNQIFNMALETLRDGLEQQHIGFELLPEKFTLSQLQRLYEIILDKKLDRRNFRKNIKKLDQVVPLDEKQKGVLHKPAQLFTYDASSDGNS